jgi:SAM-dependent MidA family methyltransferase
MDHGREEKGSAGDSLIAQVRRRIAATGPITFAEYMEMALYDPEAGFYARPPVGERGHFVTSPHLSSAFAVLVARQIHEFWSLLGTPDPFDVVEVGAGNGRLARDLLATMDRGLRRATRYTAVERSAGAIRSIRESPELSAVRVATELEDTPEAGSLVGCLLANELLDNLPFHRIRRTATGWRELLVGMDQGRLTTLEGPLSDPALGRLAPDIDPGQEAPVSPEAIYFVERAAKIFAHGYVWLVDFGFGPDEPPQPVHGYRRQRVEADVFADPGSMDITAGVDFGAIVRHATAIGLQTWGPASQRDVLLALGFRDWDRSMRQQQVTATSARRGIEALRLFSDRSRGTLLIDRGALGRAKVLCVGVGSVPRPLSFGPPPAEGERQAPDGQEPG